MWFCFSSDFLNLPFTQHIREKTPKYSSQFPKHILDALQLISQSLNYPVTMRGPSSAIAWEVLIEDGILREVEGGYSAIEWLTEQGLFIDKKKPRFAQSHEERTAPTAKVAVRDNVLITENEKNSLKEKYPSDVIERAFDVLSDYKRRTGKIYRSDYRALLAWAIDAALSPKYAKPRQNEEAQHIPEQCEQEPQREVTPEQKARNLERLNEFLNKL